VDVRCKDQNGRQFIVEMQMIWSPDYNQRALFNAAKAYSRELPVGGNYRNLKTVYSLNLLNENLDLDVPQWYHHYQMEHHEIKGETIDGLQLVFVELKKFKPHSWPERKMAVLWLRFLTEIDGTIRDAPSELKENPEVRKALEMVEASALTPEERARYDGFQDWLCRETRRANAERRAEKIPELEAKYNAAVAKLDAVTACADAATARADAATARADAATARADAATARADAATARADEAEAKLRQDKLETARNLKTMNLTIEQIAAATGLAVDEIKTL
jgi:predicted transposase/invertase (TIGR01784 family)